MNLKDLGEMNPAAPSRTRNAPADVELARAYLTRRGDADLSDGRVLADTVYCLGYRLPATPAADDESEPLTEAERGWLDGWRDRCDADPALMRHEGYVEMLGDILRHREAAAATKARADERERIAQAIEVMPIADRWLSGIHLVQRDDAARIARDGGR